jgi:hypothetical protein
MIASKTMTNIFPKRHCSGPRLLDHAPCARTDHWYEPTRFVIVAIGLIIIKFAENRP